MKIWYLIVGAVAVLVLVAVSFFAGNYILRAGQFPGLANNGKTALEAELPSLAASIDLVGMEQADYAEQASPDGGVQDRLPVSGEMEITPFPEFGTELSPDFGCPYWDNTNLDSPSVTDAFPGCLDQRMGEWNTPPSWAPGNPGNGRWGMGPGMMFNWNNQQRGWHGMHRHMQPGYQSLDDGPITGEPDALLPPPTPAADVSYQEDIRPIFDQYCTACHGDAAGLSLDTYNGIKMGGSSGAVIIPGSPEQSRLVWYIVSGYMPFRGAPLSEAEIQAIVNWVAAGAPEN